MRIFAEINNAKKKFKQFCKQGTEMAVGLQVEQVAVQVQEKWRQSGWVSVRKQGKKTVHGPRVWSELARSDRGFEGNSRAQIAGFLLQWRSDRGFGVNRRGLGRGFFATVAVGPRVWSEQARSRSRVF